MPKLTRAFKGRVLAVHRLEDKLITIGRNADCDIQIDSLAVAPRNVELMTKGESCQLKALDPEYPVYINGQQIQSALLNHGDILHIGKHSFTFAMDGVAVGVHANAGENPPPLRSTDTEDAEPVKRKKSAAYIQIQSGTNIGRIILLNQNITQLGKPGGNCAIIAHRQDGYYLAYLEGDKVTVNGFQVGTESILLRDGSLIQIGATRFQFYG